MTILNNKRSFLGSDNKLKYVLSSFGKEKKDKNYTFWRFLKYPPCPTPIDENRGIEEVGGRKLKKGRYEWGSKSSAFSSRALPLSDNRIGISRVPKYEMVCSFGDNFFEARDIFFEVSFMTTFKFLMFGQRFSYYQ